MFECRPLASIARDNHAPSICPNAHPCTYAYTLSSAQQEKNQQNTNAHKLKETISVSQSKPTHLSTTRTPRRIPLRDLHGSMLVQVLVHVESVPQQVRLVAPALAQALKLGAVEVVGQDGLVVRVRALLDDLAGALARRHAGDVGEADFGDDHVDCGGGC
jgi:hypothetical protein